MQKQDFTNTLHLLSGSLHWNSFIFLFSHIYLMIFWGCSYCPMPNLAQFQRKSEKRKTVRSWPLIYKTAFPWCNNVSYIFWSGRLISYNVCIQSLYIYFWNKNNRAVQLRSLVRPLTANSIHKKLNSHWVGLLLTYSRGGLLL